MRHHMSYKRGLVVTIVLLIMSLLGGQSTTADAQTAGVYGADPLAPADSVYVSADGRVGIGTSNPVSSVVMIEQVIPEIRLAAKPLPDAEPFFVEGGDFVLGTGWGGAGERKAFYVYDERADATRLVIDRDGFVGIGTSDPVAPLVVEHVNPELKLTSKPLPYEEPKYIEGGAFSLGTGYGQLGDRKAFYIWDDKAGVARLLIDADGHVGIGRTDPEARLNVEGTTRTGILQITGGSDLAEPFEITDGHAVSPGMVVVIDPDQPGQLRIADSAYDHRVAGVVSGAGGVQPGLVMQQEGTHMVGSHPVALTGRVYVLADTTNGSIEPGDLLTTSDVPGHAMKATDREQAFGATLGKAMSPLYEGTGLVLVLIALQ